MRLRHVLFALAALGAACQRAPEPTGATPERSDKLVRAAEPIRGQYLVSLAPGQGEAGARALAKRYGATVLRYHGAPLDVVALQLAPERAGALAQDAAVRLAEEDSFVHVASVPWHLDRVDQRALPLDGQTPGTERGKGVHVYIVDTGVLAEHPELAGRADAPLSTVAEPVDSAPSSGDCHGHGTHLAALVAGKTTGVASGASVHALRAVDCDGVGAVSSIVAALDWLGASHASPAVALVGVTAGHSPTLSQALQKTLEAGVTVVAPAGNSGQDACGTLPAAHPSVIAVGASDSSDAVAPYSNQGRCVSLFAPGQELSSAWNDGAYHVASGTSQAAALVAGAAAAFLEQYPQATPQTVAAALVGNATLGLPTGRAQGSPDRLLYTGFIAAPVPGSPLPTVGLDAPTAGAEVTGTVLLRASATGPVSQVAFYADGLYLGADATRADGFSLSWDTHSLGNGSHSLLARAYDAAGNVAESSVSVLLKNPGNASYDSVLRVPACLEPGQRCATGTLLTGRGPVGPEAHAPNTLQAACQDGASGVYQRDESVEAIEVELPSAAGASFAEGQTVNVSVKVWAYPDHTSDQVDLYFADDALAPSWKYLGTVTPSVAGEQWVHFTYRLPAVPAGTASAARCVPGTSCAGLQAVRATLRFGGERADCTTGRYDDHDDLAFAVASGSADTVAPTVSITSPEFEAALSGSTLLVAEASDDSQVVRVEFYLDEALIATSWTPDASSGRFRATWNADSVPLRSEYVLTAVAYDSSGNAGRSVPLLVNVEDLAPPTVELSLPAPDGVVGGVVTVEAVASDNRAVQKVRLVAGGITLGEVTTPPYSLRWDTRGLSGEQTLVAVATDGAGHETTSAELKVVVDNEAPTVSIGAPTSGAEVHGVVQVSGSAKDGDEIARVELFAQGVHVADATYDAMTRIWYVAWNSGTFENIPVELVARAYDRAGNTADSAPLTVLVHDTTGPTVAVTAPAEGALVQGLVRVAAAAEDDGLVAKVEFYADGVRLFTDVEAPFEGMWDSGAFADGKHVLTARAYDVAGNLGESAGVSLTVDNLPPDVAVQAPSTGTVSGAVEIVVRASDLVEMDSVDVHIDGVRQGTAKQDTADATLYRLSWSTTDFDNRAFTVTAVAYDRIGNVRKSTPVVLSVSNPTTAEYSAGLAAPACEHTAAWCTSGTLLDGAGTAEAHGPNTVAGSCRDGQAGEYHVQESVDRITVRSTNYGPLAAGQQVTVELRYWAAAANESDQVDVYYAADARNPTWMLIDTLTPPKVGENVSPPLTYTLPTGPLQAVRAAYRFGSKGPTPCATAGLTQTQLTASYDDYDDLVFAVGSPADTAPPQVALTAPSDRGVVSGDVEIRASASDDVGIARVEFRLDGALLGTSTVPPYSVVWPAGQAADGAHTLSLRAFDTTGNTAQTDPISVTVRNVPNAVYDTARSAPACATPASFCISGDLLDGRSAAPQLGPERNAPNTLQSSCLDGEDGTYHVDESIDWVKVSTLDGQPFAPGKRVKVEVRVWAYSGFSDDSLDLFYATSADAPAWRAFATLKPTDRGAQVLSAEYTLPPGEMQAVRARFRYQGWPGDCYFGGPETRPTLDDIDDLAFAVVYQPNASYETKLAVPSCASAASCDSGSLVTGRGPLGPETHQPNTLHSSCADGTVGTYGKDASIERVMVMSLDGTSLLRAGKLAHVEVQALLPEDPSGYRVDLFLSEDADAASPVWKAVASPGVSRGGRQTFAAEVSLGGGSRQALRAHLRKAAAGDAAQLCGTGSTTAVIDDQDDVVVSVQP